VDFGGPETADPICHDGLGEGLPEVEPRSVTSQVRHGLDPEASRRTRPVKILAPGRQLGRVAN